MRLVNSVLSKEPLNESEIHLIKSILKVEFSLEVKVHTFKYVDRKYYESDFDVIDVSFSKESIYKDINRLIKVYLKIFPLIEKSIDVIIANDDTETEILQYEDDYNDISGFGLFITNRIIPGIQPFYKSDICNAYLNFKNVSFGVIY